MIVQSSIEASRTRRRASSDGTPFHHTTFIGENRIARKALGLDGDPVRTPGELYPMGFLVEQDVGTIVRAHFHQSDQWQVVVGGSGQLASHEIAPVSLHYTNAHSAYGPIKAGAGGLVYFTLRNGWDPGARYMPEARGELRAATGRAHREAMADPEPVDAPAPLAAAGRSTSRTVIGLAADGLAAWRYQVAAADEIRGPDPAGGAGQFWLVVSGELVQPDGTRLPRLSLVFVHPDDEPFAPTAGAIGAELIALQFPRRPD